MKIYIITLLFLASVFTANGQLPIDTTGRSMITMKETVTKPYKLGSVYYERGSNKPFTGILYGRYDNGNLLTMQEFVDGIGNGNWIDFDPEGRMVRKGTYINNKVEGPITEYYENGNIKSVGQYVHWKNPIGKWVYYDEKGNVVLEMNYTR